MHPALLDQDSQDEPFPRALAEKTMASVQGEPLALQGDAGALTQVGLDSHQDPPSKEAGLDPDAQEEPRNKEAGADAQQEPRSKEAGPDAREEPHSKEAGPDAREEPRSKEAGLDAREEPHSTGAGQDACQELSSGEASRQRSAMIEDEGSELPADSPEQTEQFSNPGLTECGSVLMKHLCQHTCIHTYIAFSLQEASLALKAGETEEQRALRIAHNIYVKFNRSTKNC